jgi:anaerobic selenocysteine-containing dehydrogenase
VPVFTTACPRNCYSTCSLRVEVEDGRLRRIEAHPGNRATPEGPCLKGLSYVERVTAPDRILHPLRRTSDGSFTRVSWDAALDEIAARLDELRRGPGPQSVLYYKASGTKGLLNQVGPAFWTLFGGYTTTYGDLCWPAGLEATRLTLGENKHNAPWDLENARLLVMWGKNPAETNIHQGVFVDRAQERGARLVVIDPRRTQTAEGADLFIQPRPGTDGAIALAVAHALIRDRAVDEGFIEGHVLGFDGFAEHVRSCTPRWAADIAEVPAGQIEELARLFAEVRPATINAGFGMQRYANSGQAVRSMIALLAITGNIGEPGAGWVFADLQSHVFDEVKDPVASFPPPEPGGPARVSISTARLGAEMLATRDPALRFAWVERGNPVTQNPDTNRVLEAFRSLDFRVVVEQFLTDTAREADLVLPAKTMFEQSDVINAYWHPYLQLKQKVFDPPGEVRPESEIYWHLAKRLGVPEEAMAGLIPEPSDEAVEAYLRRHLATLDGVTLEDLREGPILAPGHEEVAFADRVFATPSGRIELISHEATRRWGVEAVPSFTESVESVRRPGGADVAGKDATGESFTDEHAGESAADEHAGESAAGRAAGFPLYFMTPNTKNRIHSQFNNLESIRAFSPGPVLHMHPRDAEGRSVGEGDTVRVFNDRGSLEVKARLVRGIKPGCVSMTNGWWMSEGGSVNLCSLGRETDMGHGAAFHDNLVQVERVG